MDLSQIGLKMNVTTKYSGKRSLLFLTIKRATFWRIFSSCRTNSSFFYRHKDICLDRKDVLEQKINQVLESVGYPSRGFVFTVRTSFDFFYIHYQEQFSWLSYKNDLEPLSPPHWSSLLSTLHIHYNDHIWDDTNPDLRHLIKLIAKIKWFEHCCSDLNSHQYQIDYIVVNIPILNKDY